MTDEQRSECDLSVQWMAAWHAGDDGALHRLVEHHLPWLRQHVERRLGLVLRQNADTGDYLHEVIVEFLRDAPRFQARDQEQLRGLLASVAENTLRDRHDWYRAKRRDLARRAPLSPDSVLSLDPALVRSTTPSREAARGLAHPESSRRRACVVPRPLPLQGA